MASSSRAEFKEKSKALCVKENRQGHNLLFIVLFDTQMEIVCTDLLKILVTNTSGLKVSHTISKAIVN